MIFNATGEEPAVFYRRSASAPAFPVSRFRSCRVIRQFPSARSSTSFVRCECRAVPRRGLVLPGIARRVMCAPTRAAPWHPAMPRNTKTYGDQASRQGRWEMCRDAPVCRDARLPKWQAAPSVDIWLRMERNGTQMEFISRGRGVK
jgi:hypothetical protein